MCRFAEGHFDGKDGLAIQRPLFHPRKVDPAGGLWSTTRDLLAYARFHLGDVGGELLSRETLDAMQAPAVESPAGAPAPRRSAAA